MGETYKTFVGGEKVSLKKDRLGWRVIHPIKNEDGSINWFNLFTGGSWIRLFILAGIILIILGCIYEYSIALKTANECLSKLPHLNPYV